MESNIISLPGLKDRRFVFRDRDHAGQILADMMGPVVGENAVLLAIPAGGVPVAIAIADATGIPFDIATVSKITLPWNTETGYGAIAFDGTMRLNNFLIERLNLTEREVQAGIEKTRDKVEKRDHALRGDRPFPDLSDKTAVLVDDGLASGFTMFCAIDAVRNAGATKIDVAVPTAHQQAAAAAAETVDRLFCPNIRSGLSFAVAEAYENWHDVSEQAIREILSRF